jgi:hypothetical protein
MDLMGHGPHSVSNQSRWTVPQSCHELSTLHAAIRHRTNVVRTALDTTFRSTHASCTPNLGSTRFIHYFGQNITTPQKNRSTTMVRAASPALTESTESSTMEATRTETLWTELQRIQQKEMEALKRQRDALEEEKESMNTLTPDDSEIVTINVGGEVIMQTTRDTICLAAPGSRFAALFSGRWEDQVVKDAEGCIFLDHDPELIRLIVNYLRIKRIDDPCQPKVDPPTAPEAKRQEWCCLLEHYGLTSFFTKPFSSLDVAKITVVQPHGSFVSTERVGDSLQLAYNGSNTRYFVACTPCLVPGTQSSWKITINNNPGWLFLGLIGKTSGLQNSFSDPTSFGWMHSNQVYVAGVAKGGIGGWTTFTQGECLHFCLDGAKLTMFSVTKKKRFVMDNVPAGDQFIHLNLS